jgi:hypothetical protein
MTREEAEQLLRKHKPETVRGSTYFPEFISSWMIDAMVESYVIGMQDGVDIAREGCE